jgi:beta-lactam-binding protein with PASTA domain
MDFIVLRFLNSAPPAARCRVPNVRGKTLVVARRSIKRARCAVGKITRKPSRKVKKGRVISQSPRAGRLLPQNSKVKLVVSRGRAR